MRSDIHLILSHTPIERRNITKRMAYYNKNELKRKDYEHEFTGNITCAVLIRLQVRNDDVKQVKVHMTGHPQQHCSSLRGGEC